MSKTIAISYKNAARLVSVACGILFSIFCFTYLYVLQQDVVEALHFTLSGGRTHYSPFAGALILTFVLWLIRWGISALICLRGWMQALTYFPSCLLLGILTDVDRNMLLGGGIWGDWMWLLPLLLILFIGLSYVLRKCFLSEADLPVLACSNLSILTLLCLMSVCIGNTDVNFHHELAVEKAIRTKDYDAARRVGVKSLETTRTLTALRHHALALDGSLGEYLFTYPQHYGAEGLLLPPQSKETLRLNADSLYQYLGVKPYATEDALEYLERICVRGEGKYTALEYYLSALLLGKQLDRFISAFDAYHGFEQDTLPRYYREALTLYQHAHPTYAPEQTDSVMAHRLNEYLLRKEAFTNPREEKNRMRREYGDTFWWYYDYQ